MARQDGSMLITLLRKDKLLPGADPINKSANRQAKWRVIKVRFFVWKSTIAANRTFRQGFGAASKFFSKSTWHDFFLFRVRDWAARGKQNPLQRTSLTRAKVSGLV